MLRLRIAPYILLVVSLAGCYGWRVEATPAATYVAETKPERVQVIRTDRTKVELFNPVVAGDSLKGLPTELAIRPITVPLSEVNSVATRHFSIKKTLGLGLIVVAAVFAYDQLMKLNGTY
jgi:hypothetical protein